MTACEMALARMDHDPEADRAVVDHIAACPSCAREWESRGRLRGRLREAVNAEQPAPELRALVNERIRAAGAPRSPWFQWRITAAAAALGLVLVAGVSYRFARHQSAATGDEAMITRLSAGMPELLRVGFADHVFCTVLHKSNEPAVPLETAAAKLDTELRPVARMVAGGLPSTFTVFLAHHCRHRGRRFVHLAARDGERLLSVVLVRKKDREALGIDLAHAAAGSYQTTAFESRDYLGYVVSDLDAPTNRQVAAAVAPSLREFLDRLS